MGYTALTIIGPVLAVIWIVVYQFGYTSSEIVTNIKTEDVAYYIYTNNFPYMCGSTARLGSGRYLLQANKENPLWPIWLSHRDTGTGRERWRLVAATDIIPDTTVYRMQPIGGIVDPDGVDASTLWLAPTVFDDRNRNGDEVTLKPIDPENPKRSYWIFDQLRIDEETGAPIYRIRTAAYDTDFNIPIGSNFKDYLTLDGALNGRVALWEYFGLSEFVLQEITPAIPPKACTCPKPPACPPIEDVSTCRRSILASVFGTLTVVVLFFMFYIRKKYRFERLDSDPSQYDRYGNNNPWSNFK